MGCFSWCTSDTKKSIPCCMPFGDLPGTVFLLNPFGEPYKETDYEGYGEFGGRDVYELVLEWNREHLTPDNIRKPDRSSYESGETGDMYFAHAMKRYQTECDALRAYVAGAEDKFIEKTYGALIGHGFAPDWKRILGISIACYDKDHVKLKYPIKIVEHPVPYEKAGISPSCPFQGAIYPDSMALIRRGVRQAFVELHRAAEQHRNSLSLDRKIQAAENKVATAGKSGTPAPTKER